MNKQKWNELDSLNLNGFDCFYKQNKDRKIIYHFTKKTEKGFLLIKSEFENIEFSLKNGWTL